MIFIEDYIENGGVEVNTKNRLRDDLSDVLGMMEELSHMTDKASDIMAEMVFNSREFREGFIPIAKTTNTKIIGGEEYYDWKRQLLNTGLDIRGYAGEIYDEYEAGVLLMKFKANRDYVIFRIESVILSYLGWLAVINDINIFERIYDDTRTYERRRTNDNGKLSPWTIGRLLRFLGTITTKMNADISEDGIVINCKIIDRFIDIDGMYWGSYIQHCILGTSRHHFYEGRTAEHGDWSVIVIDMKLNDEAQKMLKSGKDFKLVKRG